jgi:hypothetical protein
MNFSRSTRESTLTVRALVALVYKRATLDALIAADHALNVSSNDQLKQARLEVQEQSKQATAANVRERLEILRRNMFWSFVILGSAVAASFLVTVLMPARFAPCRAWLGGLSLFIFAWGTLGRLGWLGESFGGGTVVERLDDRIFLKLSIGLEPSLAC